MSRPAAGFFAGTYLADCIAGDPARCRALLAEKAGAGESSEKLLPPCHHHGLSPRLVRVPHGCFHPGDFIVAQHLEVFQPFSCGEIAVVLQAEPDEEIDEP